MGFRTGRGGAVRRRSARVAATVVAVLALMASALFLGQATGLAAPAPTQLKTCDKFGSFPVGGGVYVVANNVWGADTPQCVSNSGGRSDTGFLVDPADHVNSTGPAGYPSIYRGCVYGYCTAGSPFPRRVDQLGTVTSSWNTSGPYDRANSQYNTSYDLWFDPVAGQTGRNTGAELMVWLNRTSWVQPIGSPVRTVTVAGASWEVWQGTLDGLPVISYVRVQQTTSVSNLPLHSFVADATAAGVVQPTWYLTSVQAGFEPWTGGAGLRTVSYSLTQKGR
jgi:hypothetical protein